MGCVLEMTFLQQIFHIRDFRAIDMRGKESYI